MKDGRGRKRFALYNKKNGLNEKRRELAKQKQCEKHKRNRKEYGRQQQQRGIKWSREEDRERPEANGGSETSPACGQKRQFEKHEHNGTSQFYGFSHAPDSTQSNCNHDKVLAKGYWEDNSATVATFDSKRVRISVP